ncbi:MAG: DUF308 domain-containing protein [Acidimicrobiales bacterium]|jgi:uncharacterized membrane protein HdeD (DUF308 family)|nr:DUF308 domain-containing protein [Acidimicrobiales bacterium]
MTDARRAMDLLRGSRIVAYSVGAISLAAGLVLLFWPDRTIVVVARIAGVLIAAIGLGECIEAVTNRGRGSYWGLLLLRGLINLAMGLLLLFWPGVTVQVVVWVFGLDLLITGAIGLIASFRVPKEWGRSGLMIRGGVGIVLGILIMAWPSVTLWILAVLIALQLILAGVVLLWSGYQLGKAEVVTS